MKINKYVTNDISNFEKQRKTTEHPTCKRNIEKYMYMYILSCNIYNKFWSWRSENMSECILYLINELYVKRLNLHLV